MSATGLEAFLARLYTDAALRDQFLRDARAACADADLDEAERRALEAIDRDGLVLAARSIAGKRKAYSRPAARRGWQLPLHWFRMRRCSF